ncbi:MAG: dihydrolipoamide acetyltransferase family protein [Halobacteriaceae archaeon]
MVVHDFELPDVGEGVAEGEIVSWLVEEGDTVEEDQVVAEVETDKALVDVPSPYNGTVKEIHYDEGDIVDVGSVIISFEVEGEPEEEVETEEMEDEPKEEEKEEEEEVAEKSTETPTGRTFAPPRVRQLARELDVDIDEISGSGPSGRVTEEDVREAAQAGEAATQPQQEEPQTETQPTQKAERERTLAVPATRKVANELDVDINNVPSSEQRDGEPFVTAEDVRQYAESMQAAQEAEAEAVQETEVTEEKEERVPYRGIRRTIGQQMEKSKFTAPHVTHHDSVDVTELTEWREELKAKADAKGVKLTYMPFIMKAVTAALDEFPYMNSQLDEENEEIIVKHYYNIGVAVGTDDGLMVPVVENVDERGLLEIASRTNELVQKARERSISREEMQGSTFTITNFGAIGGEYATPIINYPEIAILGLGEIKQRPRVVDGEVQARYTLPLSLSIDHRVVDGALAAQFVNQLKEYLNNPKLLVL